MFKFDNIRSMFIVLPLNMVSKYLIIIYHEASIISSTKLLINKVTFITTSGLNREEYTGEVVEKCQHLELAFTTSLKIGEL
jgi:hypothetical protein